FFFQAEDGIRDYKVTGVQTCPLPIFLHREKILRLPKRDRGTIVSSQAGETRRRSLDDLDLEIAFPKSAERQQLARGNCNRTCFRSEERRVGKECKSRGEL